MREPGALFFAGEREEPDGVLAHVRFHEHPNARSDAEPRQRARARLHQIAHAGDLDQRCLFANRAHDALQ